MAEPRGTLMGLTRRAKTLAERLETTLKDRASAEITKNLKNLSSVLDEIRTLIKQKDYKPPPPTKPKPKQAKSGRSR